MVRAIKIISIVFIAVAEILLLYKIFWKPDIEISGQRIEFGVSDPVRSNNYQYNSSTWMGVFEGRLFILQKENGTEYSNILSVFENGSLKKIKEVNFSGVIGYCYGYLYYYEAGEEVGDDYLVKCYNFFNNTITTIYKGKLGLLDLKWFSEDGLLYIPIVEDKEDSFLCIRDGQIKDRGFQYFESSIGGITYHLERSPNRITSALISVEKNIKKEKTILLGVNTQNKITMLSAKTGLVIHYQSGSDPLYYIDGENTIIKLLNIDCNASISCVAVKEETVYFSFRRYEKLNSTGKGYAGFENDETEGTYRINLTDKSIHKISDMVFDGLFLFGDDAVYACDREFNLYRLDMDDNIVDLLSVKKHTR
ncbi:MAG: hypothetical protein IJS22_05030 [Lachnospiraceae bacterium]|nr:hypothetical protein [Lachnospiraceae bacterium]